MMTQSLYYNRARIKGACDQLRDVVPGMTGRTDKATVFEYAVEYIRYMKNVIGDKFDQVNYK